MLDFGLAKYDRCRSVQSPAPGSLPTDERAAPITGAGSTSAPPRTCHRNRRKANRSSVAPISSPLASSSTKWPPGNGRLRARPVSRSSPRFSKTHPSRSPTSTRRSHQTLRASSGARWRRIPNAATRAQRICATISRTCERRFPAGNRRQLSSRTRQQRSQRLHQCAASQHHCQMRKWRRRSPESPPARWQRSRRHWHSRLPGSPGSSGVSAGKRRPNRRHVPPPSPMFKLPS